MNRKPIFDTVRAMLGRSFTKAEVDKLDDAIDIAEGAIAAASTVPKSTAPNSKWTLGSAGTKLIQSFEGCYKERPDGRFCAYPDPGSGDGKPWTIGWGSTGSDVTPSTIWTRQQCDDRFKSDMQRYANDVAKAIGTAPTTQNQFDAMCSFHYNTGAISKATLTKRHKAGDYKGAQAAFAMWNKNNGKVMKGLVRRRAAEAELYGKP